MKPKSKGFAQEGALTSPRSRACWNVLKGYHPYRYAAYRPWAPELLKKYQNLNSGKLVSTEQDPDLVARRLRQTQRNLGTAVSLNRRSGT